MAGMNKLKRLKAKLINYAIFNHSLAYSIPLVGHGQELESKSLNVLKIIVIIIIVLSLGANAL